MLSVGDLYLFLVYLGLLYGPVESLAYLTSGLSKAHAQARRVFEVLDAPEPIDNPDPAEARTLPQPTTDRGSTVRFDRIRFGYDLGRPVLCDVDLEIPAGATVAFVGPSGVGKTTLLSMVPRFIDPWEGAVRIDGVDVRQVRLDALRSHVAWVMQEPMLMPMTIAENIAYGRPSASRSEIIEAANLANIHEFIQNLPDGYATLVGERGATLSGGQAQRIAIARAALYDAPILILDEPTSALDAHTEAMVMEALHRLSEQRTTLIVAHRLSTVCRADHIVVLKNGRIFEQGTHAQLLEMQGEYHRLVQVQGLLKDDTTLQ